MCKILTGTLPYLADAHNFSFNTHTLHIIYITIEKPHYCINNAHEYLVHTTSAQPLRKNNHQLTCPHSDAISFENCPNISNALGFVCS